MQAHLPHSVRLYLLCILLHTSDSNGQVCVLLLLLLYGTAPAPVSAPPPANTPAVDPDLTPTTALILACLPSDHSNRYIFIVHPTSKQITPIMVRNMTKLYNITPLNVLSVHSSTKITLWSEGSFSPSQELERSPPSGTPVSGEYYKISRQYLGKTTSNPPK